MTEQQLMAIVNEALLDATAPFSRPKDPLSMKEFCLSFAERVAAAEREACAELCEALRLFHSDDIGYSELPYKECALNIRKRGAP